MNKFAIYFWLALVSLLFAPLPALAAVHLAEANLNSLSNGLIAYWPLDGDTTNWTTDTTADVSGNGNTGTLVSMSTTTSPVIGKIGQALQFNGGNSGINTPVTPGSQGTVSVWIRPATTLNASSPDTTIAFAGRNSLFEINWAAPSPPHNCNNGATLPNGSINFVISPGGGQYSVGCTTTTTWNAGQWYFLSATWDGSAQKLYVNGVLQDNVTQTFAGGWTAPLSLAGQFSFFDGTIDDVRNYNRALSPQEIQMLYEMGSFQLGNTVASNSSFSIAQGGIGSGLVAYWPLDGNTTNWSNGTTNDMSGNGNTGFMSNLSTTTSPVPGVIGQAINFLGSSSNLIYGYNSGDVMSTSNAPFTIALWVKPTSLTCGGNVCSMLNNETYNTNGFRFGVGPQMSNEFQFWTTESGGTLSIDSDVVAAVNTWYDAVVTYNGSKAIMYINGVPQSNTSTGTYIGTTNGMIIGGEIGGKAPFNGPIDDVRIYNRALLPQEVAQLYQAGKVKIAHSNTSTSIGLNSGLVGYWSFDGPTINWATGVVKDASGNSSNSAQMYGMSTSTSPVIGKIGQALNFNGSNQDVLSQQSEPLNADTGIETMSAWFKTTSDGTILAADDTAPPGTPTNYDELLYVETNGYLQAGAYANPGNIPTLNSTAPVNDGKWHFAALTFNGSAQTLYVDGVPVGTYSATIFGTTNPYWIVGNGYSNGWPNSNNSWFYFNGTIDDVRIYNRALSAQEVAQLYAAGR